MVGLLNRCVPLACLLSFCGSCASAPASLEQAVSVVPTAVMVQEGAAHFGVVSADSRFHQMACLSSAKAADVVVEITLETPDVEAVALLRRGDGFPDERIALRAGQQTHRIERRVGGMALGLCVELFARQGSTVYQLNWRAR